MNKEKAHDLLKQIVDHADANSKMTLSHIEAMRFFVLDSERKPTVEEIVAFCEHGTEMARPFMSDDYQRGATGALYDMLKFIDPRWEP